MPNKQDALGWTTVGPKGKPRTRLPDDHQPPPGQRGSPRVFADFPRSRAAAPSVLSAPPSRNVHQLSYLGLIRSGDMPTCFANAPLHALLHGFPLYARRLVALRRLGALQQHNLCGVAQFLELMQAAKPGDLPLENRELMRFAHFGMGDFGAGLQADAALWLGSLLDQCGAHDSLRELTLLNTKTRVSHPFSPHSCPTHVSRSTDHTCAAGLRQVRGPSQRRQGRQHTPPACR